MENVYGYVNAAGEIIKPTDGKMSEWETRTANFIFVRDDGHFRVKKTRDAQFYTTPHEVSANLRLEMEARKQRSRLKALLESSDG